MSVEPLWSVEAMAQAMRAERAGALPAGATGISIDSRSIAPGEAFFAIAGENTGKRTRGLGARNAFMQFSRERVRFLQNAASFRIFVLRRVLVADNHHEFHAGGVIGRLLSGEDVFRPPQQLVDGERLARRRGIG